MEDLWRGPIWEVWGDRLVEGDWHHHVDELAICFQDPQASGALQAQGDFG